MNLPRKYRMPSDALIVDNEVNGDCYCEIRAAGSNDDLVQLRHLFDVNTTYANNDERTCFESIVKNTLKIPCGSCRELGRFDEGEFLWGGDGEGGPPGKFVTELSAMFPRVTFSLTLSIENSSVESVYQIFDQKIRLIYAMDGLFEFCGVFLTRPVDHYRVSINIDKAVELALFQQAFLERWGRFYVSRHDMSSVLDWIESSFPGLKADVNWWLPFRPNRRQSVVDWRKAALYLHDSLL